MNSNKMKQKKTKESEFYTTHVDLSFHVTRYRGNELVLARG